MSRTFDQVVEEEKAFHRASVALDEMPSCTNCFDRWASCFALGPQIKSVYRFGTGQDCKDKLDDFKFCLTLKGMSQEEKYEAWIHRKAQKSATKRLGPESSENVWEIRRDTSVDQEAGRQSQRFTVS
ncbi:uncharacterized protein PFL1_05507 [Pseudozyma flocculosa PF-1]|uniref:Early meiotic induction protein 1 n=1 Tax=Pseudozyma flocculosa PF-1 TaxID=1277687 RepID=A0A061H2C0_9BASI|nr:uncharacterized protein PFL1_05507 [Pseudozyma flocculosa PF-1]EPQ26872.1 hypothetical protein PFL1_05507 [Pseudozyma flocculosa PF-1]